ncbi:hypothetical protein D9613_011853 [Agrocybe pediades]|uniref:F-box domain-containing protein n=1 Tax=Agrocybe pediades TaxID=84607 RepID=A0A8H4VLS8_9AGAR|nr:hypothetical protein D9613_011853 [Agrocybe pediades]
MHFACGFELTGSDKRCTVDVLPPELLLEIFLNNTEPTNNWEDKRLTTARYTSQVCQKWRSLILPSTRIWGRLLSMHSIEDATEDWVEELRSRVGGAKLWITGSIQKTSSRSYLISLLKEKWENVQIFHVRIFQPGTLEELWPILQSKAPTLEVLRVEIIYHSNAPNSRPLFDDMAPRLRDFHTFAIFSPVAPWLYNLQSIVFGSQHAIMFILSALKSMPLLRTLEVFTSDTFDHSGTVMHGGDVGATSVYLPRLTRLCIYQRHFQEVSSLLNHIESPGCDLYVRGMRGLSTGSAIDIQRTYAAMVKWVSAFIDIHRPKVIEVGTCTYSMRPFISIMVSPELHYQNPSSDLILPLSSRGFSALRELAACPGLSSIQRLNLTSGPKFWDELLPFYRALSGVTEIAVDADLHNMQVFQHDGIPHGQIPDFPLLRTLRICALQDFSVSVGSIFDFLEYRAGVGFPVLLLEFSEYCSDGFTEDQKEYIRQHQVDGLVIKMPPT